MCGIAGYFGTQPPGESELQGCLVAMGRRGPDHAARRAFRGPGGRTAVLLHARLNIIDLDPRSNQPFRVGGKWLSYNGELYNYVEVRDALARQGRRFATGSDTEVLLAGIDHFGWDALDRYEGMWAFAAYDEADGSLTLCRDRFGEKPLYVYRDGAGLYFGSEPKFIAALLGRRLRVNMDQVYRHLVNGYKALYKDGHTFFEGLEEVEAGTTLRLSADGKEETRRYWSPAYRPDQDMSYEDAVAGVRERLIRSVELRLRADVPLAFCMSGGIDSNALISIAKRRFGYDVHGFTIQNTDSRYEEQDMVDCAVAELGVRHDAVPVETREFIPRLQELVRYHDAPVYTITYYAHWLLMKSVAARGYHISVSGSAADELFTGYYDHHLAYLYELREQPQLQAVAREAWSRHIKPLVRNPYLGNPDLFVDRPEQREHIFLGAEGFSRALRRPWAEPFRERRFTESLLRNRMLNELFHENVPVILHEDDLNAMYYSIENRSPFLDRALFEFSYSIPSRHLIRDGRAKAVLRDAMKGLIPEPVRVNRRKVGFNAPILSFLDAGDRSVREWLLADSPVFEHVRRESIETVLAKPELPNSESKFVFNFLNAKIFLEAFL